MYSSKTNVNILTSVLRQHDIGRYVLCPGSRNAPLVNNMNLLSKSCYPVLDERSAAFMASGLAEATGLPAVVCVTSGSALANTMPAVVEAYYRGVPLVVISADRPKEWIDQHDGQTMRQEGFFGTYAKTCNLPEVAEDADPGRHQYVCRLANEALTYARMEHRPVHINVPISEPLYDFSVTELSQERVMRMYKPCRFASGEMPEFVSALRQAERPLVVVGQLPFGADMSALSRLARQVPVLMEPLGGDMASPLDALLEHLSGTSVPLPGQATCCSFGEADFLRPDVIIYIGGELVSKRLKQWLRQAKDAKTFRITPWGDSMEDTFLNLTAEYEIDGLQLLEELQPLSFDNPAAVEDYREFWHVSMMATQKLSSLFEPAFSSFSVVQRFVKEREEACCVCYGNSMPVRLACIHEHGQIRCNRGVNGIEGSISAAAGISLKYDGGKIYCVVGDLSFLYDHNCLQCPQLDGRFRILVLNNGGGAIFGKFEGLRQSEARPVVMGRHSYSAEGICQTFDVYYLSARNEEELDKCLPLFFRMDASRPVVLEVFTDMEQDNQVIQKYFKSLKE